MKSIIRFLYGLSACCLTAISISSCVRELEMPRPGAGSGENGSICIDLGKDIRPSTRAEASGAETVVDHLDILIFAQDGTFQWHERASLSDTDGSGKITLGARRDGFVPGGQYWVYLVANSSHASTEFDGLDLDGLRSMTEETRDVHVTGSTVQGAPRTFLMDGVACPASSIQSSPSAVVLNDGDPSGDTLLKAELRRAAAKIVVKVGKGDKVSFDSSTAAGYYISNMPYTTSLVSGIDAPASLRTPDRFGGDDFFKWTEDNITVTSYSYAHDWTDASSFESEVRLVVNIPMTFDGVEYPNSYYQIPVSRTKVLKRNTCYEVRVTVDAPGALDPSKPVELDPVSYEVLDWTERTVNIGGEDDVPAYLSLNRQELEMDNVEEDYSSISFASSSDVQVAVTRVYYYDKFGQLKEVRDHGVVAGTRGGTLNGNISVYSPLPTNNTTRYIDLEVSNLQGLTRTVTVKQYPLEYITSIQSWYSYRSDFGGTTYELLNGQDVAGKEFSSNIENRYVACDYSAARRRWVNRNTHNGNFFGSKVAEQNSDGTSAIKFYVWDEDFYFFGWYYSYSIREITDGSISGLDNARMYHVRITSTSEDYVLGIPRRNSDGLTDDGADNAKLVSPSFMIASQLGAVLAAETVEIAGSHCSEYVEVYKDPDTGTTVHLDDWRLPTEAELNIIMKFQYVENAAMDEVLSGSRYWSASGLVTNTHVDYNEGDAAIRCIRDVY